MSRLRHNLNIRRAFHTENNNWAKRWQWGGGEEESGEYKRYMDFLVRSTNGKPDGRRAQLLKVLDKEGLCIMDPLNKEQRMKTFVSVYELPRPERVAYQFE